MQTPARAAIAHWCEQHLGARPVDGPLFERTHLSHVVGLALDNGRNVVIKVRPWQPRIVACTRTQKRLFRAGFRCPPVLAGPVAVDGWAVTAEGYMPGGDVVSHGSELAAWSAHALAELIRLAPRAQRVGSLDPAPEWVRWDHGEPGLWPPRDDGDDDLTTIPMPVWLMRLGWQVRHRLAEDHSRLVIGHADWEAQNLRFIPDGQLYVVHGWDSVALRTEAMIVGAAAAVYTASGHPLSEATVEQTEAFLDAYQAATKRRLSSSDLEACWAAGLWVRAYNAAKEYVDGVRRAQAAGAQPGTLDEAATSLLDRLHEEAPERLRRAAG
jgi:hypothetical protein